MKTNILKVLPSLLLVLGLGGASYAGTVNFNADVNSPADSVWQITGFTANGFTMGGKMTVTITFSDSSFVTVAWAGTSGTCGQATGAAGNGTWLLAECGDTGAVGDPAHPETTAVNEWALQNTSTNLGITKVVLSSTNTGIVFDRDRATATGADSGGQEGTPGSALGITYTFGGTELGPGNPYTVGVTYSNIVTLQSLPGGTPCNGPAFSGNTTGGGCGDEWGSLAFQFSSAFGGTPANAGNAALWTFFQDTDLVGVPEPMSLGLAGFGLLGIAAIVRRRRNTAAKA